MGIIQKPLTPIILAVLLSLCGSESGNQPATGADIWAALFRSVTFTFAPTYVIT